MQAATCARCGIIRWYVWLAVVAEVVGLAAVVPHGLAQMFPAHGA